MSELFFSGDLSLKTQELADATRTVRATPIPICSGPLPVCQFFLLLRTVERTCISRASSLSRKLLPTINLFFPAFVPLQCSTLFSLLFFSGRRLNAFSRWQTNVTTEGLTALFLPTLSHRLTSSGLLHFS